MPRSEDYLDSLLDSIKDGDNKNVNDRGSRGGSSESSYLRDFERDAFGDMSSDEEADFLTDFENDMGFDIREGARGIDVDEPDIPQERELQVEIQKVLDDAEVSRESSSKDKSITDSLDDILRDISGDDEDFTSDDDIAKVVSDSVKSADASDENDILEGLTDIMESDDSTGEAPDDTPEPAAAPEPAAPAPSAPSEPEDDEELLSDIDSEEEDPAIPGLESSEPGEAPAEAEVAPAEAEAGEGGAGNMSDEEIMDIGNLLDSIDEEGNLTEAEQGAPVTELRDEPSPAAESEEKAEGEGEEKQSFIQKLLGKLLKKKKGDDEEAAEEGQAEGEAVVAAASGEAGEEEEPVDKKAAKAAEKERKKKEKEEAKKKAAAEKKEKAKQPKEKKEKKKKKKEPDTSPKIPIIVIVPFVVLAISIFILWNVLKDNISYSTMIRGAKSLYDNERYYDSYKAIDGAELTEEDMLFGQKAQLLAMLEMRLVQYQVYTESKNRSHINALDALVKGVVYYEDHKQEAESIAIKDPFDKLGKSLVEALAIYELTPEDADELMDIREREEYTVELYFILERLGLWSLEE